MVKKTTPHINLTPEQQAAIETFAAHYGYNWKHFLTGFWRDGYARISYDLKGITPLLQQVRNQAGPRWLKDAVVGGQS